MRIGSYKEAIEYIESFIRPTVFARIESDKQLVDPLQRMRYLLELLGNPQEKYQSVQVSGTSGKGSTAYLISHILKTSGYRVAFTLSPHLEKINERMQVNNIPVSDDNFISLVNEVIPVVEKMSGDPIGKPSYFELVLALSLLYFAKKKVDIVVAEVGLEGKYDGTNVLHPLVAILTNISLDHTRILGNTVEKIAEEATSIIKEKHMTVITGINQEELQKIVREKAEAVEADVIWVEKEMIYNTRLTTKGSVFSLRSSQKVFKDLTFSLLASYQFMNATMAIEAVLALKNKGFRISEAAIRQALASSHFPGRFEVFQPLQDLRKNPLIILDGAHNPVKMAAFIQSLTELYPETKKVFLIAFKEDKNIDEMLKCVLPEADAIITTQFTFSTDLQKNAAFPVDKINTIIKNADHVPELHSLPSLPEAFRKSQELAARLGGIVIVTGSLYLVGEVRTFLH